MGVPALDEIDRQILEILQKDGRVPVTKLSEILNKPRTTIASRIERLEKLGYIRGYRAEVDPRKLGYRVVAYVLISVARTGPVGGKSSQVLLAEKILKDSEERNDLPWVEEASVITGPYDILLKVWARSIEELSKFLIEYLPSLSGVVKTETLLVLECVGERHYWPLKQ